MYTQLNGAVGRVLDKNLQLLLLWSMQYRRWLTRLSSIFILLGVVVLQYVCVCLYQ